MIRGFGPVVLLIGGTIGLAAALVGAGGRAQTAPEQPHRQVYESSIGGVVPASSLPGLQGQGYLVYSKWCAGCHAPDYAPKNTANGVDLPESSRFALGTNILRQRYKGTVPAALEDRTDLTPEIVATFVRQGLNAMPAFRKTEITDTELKALGAYLSRNNKDVQSPR